MCVRSSQVSKKGNERTRFEGTEIWIIFFNWWCSSWDCQEMGTKCAHNQKEVSLWWVRRNVVPEFEETPDGSRWALYNSILNCPETVLQNNLCFFFCLEVRESEHIFVGSNTSARYCLMLFMHEFFFFLTFLWAGEAAVLKALWWDRRKWSTTRLEMILLASTGSA